MGSSKGRARFTISSYIVAGCSRWNRHVFEDVIRRYPGQWRFIGEREQLSLDAVRALNDRYIFFLHCSWKVLPQVRDIETAIYQQVGD